MIGLCGRFKVGDIVDTSNGKVKIVMYSDGKTLPNGDKVRARVTLQFIDSGWITTVSTASLYAGNIKDKLARTVHGVGYLGTNMKGLRTGNSIPHRACVLWRNMLERCYGGYKHWSKYADCTVAERWHCFKTFLDDISKLEGYDRWARGEDMQLDKDIKVKGNRVYSLETCMFVTAFDNRSDGGKRNKEK